MTATVTVPGTTATHTQTSTRPDSSAGAVLAWCGLALVLLCQAYRAFVATLLVAAMVPMLWGWTSHVVRSGSMEPALSVGDVVVAKPFSDQRLPLGKVMLFTPPGADGPGELRVHRVVENLGKGTYITAGDANRSDDPEPVRAEDFRARPIINVPFIGLPMASWFSGDLLELLILLGVTAAAFYFASRPPCDPRHRRRRERTRARRAADRAGLVLRRILVPVAAAVAMAVAATTGLAQADAAFNATTRSSANTWRVSSTLASSLVLANPGFVVRGTVPLTASLSNAGSLAYSVRIEYAVTGTTSWTTICTRPAAPYTCSWVTTGLTNQRYDLRAVATSGSMSYTSDVVERVLVDNLVTSIVMNDPGPYLSGTVTLTATASSTAGVASVRIQGRPAGTTVWSDVCTDTSSPYSCSYNTRAAPDGLYDMRAILTDGLGRTTISDVVANRTVDNTAPRGFDVQTTNSGNAGKLDAGDTMSLTYNELMKTGTFTSGWDGSALAVTLRLRDGGLLGLGSKDDSVDLLRSGSAVNLGSVNLFEDYISTNLTAQFNASVAASTTTVNGISATRITITVGSQTTGQTVRTVFLSSTMSWRPSALATDLAGRPASTVAVSESGAADRQF